MKLTGITYYSINNIITGKSNHIDIDENCEIQFVGGVGCLYRPNRSDIYRNTVSSKEKEIRNNQLWLKERDDELAKRLFMENFAKKQDELSQKICKMSHYIDILASLQPHETCMYDIVPNYKEENI